jgi:hypothetical protein
MEDCEFNKNETYRLIEQSSENFKCYKLVKLQMFNEEMEFKNQEEKLNHKKNVLLREREMLKQIIVRLNEQESKLESIVTNMKSISKE